MKTFELLTIIGTIAAVGIALGAVIIGSNANLHTELRAEMRSLRAETRTELHAEITEVRSDIRALETRLSAVERGQARIEGLLEGLRDAITAQRFPESRGQNEAT